MLKSPSLKNIPDLVSLICCIQRLTVCLHGPSNVKVPYQYNWKENIQTNKHSTIPVLRNPALAGSSMGRVWNDHGTGGYWHREHSAKWIKSSSLIKSAVFAINNNDREQNVRDLLHFAIFSIFSILLYFLKKYFYIFASFSMKKILFQFNNGSLRNVLDMLICVTIDWAAVIWFLCAHFSSASAAEGYMEFVGDCLGTSSNVGYIVCCHSLSHTYLNNRK